MTGDHTRPHGLGMVSFLLSAFLFAFAMSPQFTPLADGAFHVPGQLECFNQRDKLLFRELIIIDAKRGKERTGMPAGTFYGKARKFENAT